LRQVDLRQAMGKLSIPLLRIYGALDGLVPRKIVPILDAMWPESHSKIIEKSAHAPFISHPELFCEQIIQFSVTH